MRQTAPFRKLLPLPALLASLAACASDGEAQRPVVQAPEARVNMAALYSTGYNAPVREPAAFEPEQAVAQAPSLPAAAPTQLQPQERAGQPDPAPERALGDDRSEARGPAAQPERASQPQRYAAPEVPAAPWQSRSVRPQREPLPDLDALIMTEGRPGEAKPLQYAEAEQRFGGETRSILDEARDEDASEEMSVEPRPEPRAAAPANPAPAMPAEPRRAGGYGLHLASYRAEEDARRGWDVLTDEHPALLLPLDPQGVWVTLPEQGDFVRLLAGPFPDEGSAFDTCGRLKAEGTFCSVVPYDGTPL